MVVEVAVSSDEAVGAAAMEERSTARAGLVVELRMTASRACLSASRRSAKFTTISVKDMKENVRLTETKEKVSK